MNEQPDIEKVLRNLKQEAIPSDTFKLNARIRILNTVTTSHPFQASWYKRPRVLGYTFGTAIATVVLSVGTVYAAQSSLPNSKLYPIKVLSERVALTLSPTTSIKSTVAGTIISRRIDEIEKVQEQGNPQEVETSIINLHKEVDSLERQKDISKNSINIELEKHKTFINSLQGDRDEDKRGTDTQEDVRHELPLSPTVVPTGETPVTLTVTPAETQPTPQTEIHIPNVEVPSIIRHNDD